MPNPNPNLSNLTRMGKGQPRKNLEIIKAPLTPELVRHLTATCQQQGWYRNYLIEQSLRAMAGIPSNYSLDDLVLIHRGAPIK